MTLLNTPPPSIGGVTLVDALAVEDRAAPTQLRFFTVALGASAGGVEALLRFFARVPEDSGCAYVVVMHLSAEHESHLAELIRKSTRIPALQVTAETAVEPNHVYIGPPGQYLEMHGGRLTLTAVPGRPRRPSAVDHLMTSLATDQRERAIGIVLTGADADGSVGVKAIKSEGGFAIAQTIQTAQHAGMPTSAVSTGAIDRQLDVEEMPQAILDYIRHSGVALLSGDAPAATPALPSILEALRSQFGIDFGGFKTPMLSRRIHRRMGLARTDDMSRYAAQVASDAREARALMDDLLINVTEFFREPETWDVLAQEVFPGLMARQGAGDAVRTWVPACASGEEAYSLAMLLLEQPLASERRLRLQVFGTDVDQHALDVARKGVYPASTIEHTVSPERLRRFFIKTGNDYQVNRVLRDCVIFAPQNVTSDPPFSHVALISCRNLLIYMGAELQRRVLHTLHFALDPGGCLVLGKSETVGSLQSLFEPMSSRARIFRRVGNRRPASVEGLAPTAARRGETPQARSSADMDRIDFDQIIREALIEHRTTAAVLTRRDGEALYYNGPIQAYLMQTDGLPTTDILAMLDRDLRPRVRAAIHEAASTRRRIETLGIARDSAGDAFEVQVAVAPVGTGTRQDLLLLTFERARSASRPAVPLTESDNSALRTLEEELGSTRRELRGAIEDLESTNEELKVANEEAMSTNEELQASNEELETSKEELQSINEELTTVNAQLQEKVFELEQVNNDLGNLLSSTHIPTLFLDRQLTIKRFTPAAMTLFRLLPGDVDRPLTDLSSHSDLLSLIDDARRVLTDLVPVEHEIDTGAGRHYLRRTVPYRTQEDRIEGVVVTFIDVSEIKRAAAAQSRLAAVMQGSDDAIVVHGLEGQILAWNRGAEELFGYSEAQALGQDVSMLAPPEQQDEYRKQLTRVLSGVRQRGLEMQRRRKDGALIDVSATASVIPGDDCKASAFASIERDISPAKRTERALRESEARFRALADNAPVLIWMSDREGLLQFVNQEFVRFTGIEAARLAGRRWTDLLQLEDRVAAVRAFGDGSAAVGRREQVNARLQDGSGRFRWMKVTAISRDGGWIGSMADVDDQWQAAQELRAADRHKDEFLAMLGHELRNPLVPIRNAAEILAHVGGSDNRVHWVRDTLVRQVEHITRLVDDLLDLSHVTRGTLQLHVAPIDLGHVVALAVENATPLIKRRHHRFECALPKEPVWVEGDSVRLAQVVLNLLDNAAKYTDEGGSLSLTLTHDTEAATIAVKDTGIGIAPEMQGRVFDLFVQDQRSLDRSEGGLGVGLALARRIVELHRGAVRASSAGVSKGSELTVCLPLLSAARIPQESDRPQAPATGGGRVLVVEDDHDAGASLVLLLNLYGYDTELAHDLATAIEAARRLRPQVVLVDLGLPGADGFEVADRLRDLPEITSATTFAAMTGFGAPADFQRTAASGFAHHLVKPVDPARLHGLLQEAIAKTAASA
ncbi:MAG: CheR family methyltransferase [Pseudomonadota bacterium]